MPWHVSCPCIERHLPVSSCKKKTCSGRNPRAQRRPRPLRVKFQVPVLFIPSPQPSMTETHQSVSNDDGLGSPPPNPPPRPPCPLPLPFLHTGAQQISADVQTASLSFRGVIVSRGQRSKASAAITAAGGRERRPGKTRHAARGARTELFPLRACTQIVDSTFAVCT